MLKKIPLYLKILIGMVLGLSWGLFALNSGLDNDITLHYLKPLGDIFTRLLKMIAVPLIIASLIVGIAGLGDTSKLSKLGGRTILLYLITTTLAISIGLLFGNIGLKSSSLSPETMEMLQTQFGASAGEKQKAAQSTFQKGPLAPLVEMIPDNIFKGASNNGAMLQVVFFTLFFGICLLMIGKEKAQPVVNFFESINHVILKMIDVIMEFAPIGVFGLVAAVVVQIPDPEILGQLALYSGTVLAGLLFMAIVVYPLFLMLVAKVKPKDIFRFYRAIIPAQLLAFSTSSSSATLPVTMDLCREKLGIRDEVTSFVLPLGATINMDGTSLYQAIATIFIAQLFGIDLDFGAQLSIIFLALLTSIGAAGVPGAGMILLAVVLEANDIPVEGIALILAVDRILDMCRTVVNVTGDATVAYIVNYTTKE